MNNKNIFYVINRILDDINCANGEIEIRIYHIYEGELGSLGELETDDSADSDSVITEYLKRYTDIDVDKITLIQL